MQCDRRPHFTDIRIVDLVFPEVLGGGVGATDFETLRAVVFDCAAHVVEKTGCEEEGETIGMQPGGVRVLGEGVRVEVDAEAVVEDCGWEALLGEVVGACADGGLGDEVWKSEGGGSVGGRGWAWGGE